MTTNNMSDEELDKLFKKSAEHFDPPYDPEAWRGMEQKLDRLATEKPWWHKYLYPLLILLLTGTVVTIIQLAREPVSSPETNTPMATGNQPAAGDQQLLRSSVPGKEQRSSAPDRQRPLSETENSRQLAAGSAEPNARQASRSQMNQSVLPEIVPLLRMRQVENIRHVPFSSATEPEADLLIPAGYAADSTAQYREQEEKSVFLRQLQFVVLAAPDITTVKFKNPEAISTNAGLLLGIPVTRKFSIVTGALWADKVYRTNPEHYVPTADFWDTKKLPSTIDAKCRILDIPVNIRYQLLDRTKAVLAVQAGVSSYFMLNEKYTYNYTYNSHPYSKTSEFSNQNRHWFAMQNMSVNYSRKITPVFSVGVEPFVKIPLSGIGAGNVKLTSAGVFLTAGYTIQLTK